MLNGVLKADQKILVSESSAILFLFVVISILIYFALFFYYHIDPYRHGNSSSLSPRIIIFCPVSVGEPRVLHRKPGTPFALDAADTQLLSLSSQQQK